MPPVISPCRTSDYKKPDVFLGTEMKVLEHSNKEEIRKDSIASENSNLASRSRSQSAISSGGISSAKASPGRSPRRSNRPGPNATLLQKAMYFRKRYPVKWAKAEKRRERELLFDNFKRSPFLQEYYEALQAVRLAKERQEELELSMPASISVQLLFNETAKFNMETRCDDKVTSYSPSDGVFGNFFADKSPEESPELVVTVNNGTNMLNNIEDDEESRIMRSKVKCYLNPDKQGTMKSSNQYLSRIGKSRWGHVFVYRDISAEQFNLKSIVFEIKGSGDDHKVVLGRATLAGKKAIISADDYQNREIETALQRALETTGQPVDVDLELKQVTTSSHSLFGRDGELTRKRTIRRKQ